jgi:hypothetical protein
MIKYKQMLENPIGIPYNESVIILDVTVEVATDPFELERRQKSILLLVARDRMNGLYKQT